VDIPVGYFNTATPFSFVLFVLFVAKLVVPSPKKYSHKEHEEHKDPEGGSCHWLCADSVFNSWLIYVSEPACA
jgi:hypothetical protein